MASLKGRYEGSVDVKGRLSIPSKCRKLLPEELVIAKHPNRDIPALVVYSDEGFDNWFEQLLEAKGGAKANDASQAQLRDEFYQDSQSASPDTIGRISIPSFLREYAGIDKDVVITGSYDHLIIRTPEMLERSRKAFESNSVYDEPASVLAE